jgi:hypothetical protein
MPIDLVLSLQP